LTAIVKGLTTRSTIIRTQLEWSEAYFNLWPMPTKWKSWP